MIRKTILLATALTLTCCAAQAQWHWQLDNIGAYLDTDATWASHPGAGTGVFPVYLIGTGLTAPSVKGVEVNISLNNATWANFQHPPGIAFQGHSPGDWTIAYHEPELVLGGQFIFAQWDMVVTDDSIQSDVRLFEIYFNSHPSGGPAYLDGDDPTLETIIPLQYSAMHRTPVERPVTVLVLNGGWVVPNENAAWGDVKALFR